MTMAEHASLTIRWQRCWMLAAWIVLAAGPAVRADVLRGFEITVEAYSDRYEIFRSLTTQVNALASPYTYFYAKADAAVGTSFGPAFPPGFGTSFLNIPGEGTRAGALVSPDPFYVRAGAYVRTPNEDPSLGGRASTSVYFGDVIRVNGPAQAAVPVQFRAEWTLVRTAAFPDSFAASALGIYEPLGQYPQLDVGLLRYFFLLALEDGIPLPGGGCDPGEEGPCFGGPEGPASLFLASYQRENRFDGNILEDPFQGLIWKYSGVTSETQQYGDGTYQFQPIPPIIIGASVFGGTWLTWTHTVLVPVGQDLYLSGGWGATTDCSAPNCSANYFSFNSAAISILLPDGYTLWSEQGHRYLGLLGEPEDPVDGEIPEPGTALLVISGLLAAAVSRRRSLTPRA
jgi:hypothetical protein